MVVFFDIDGVVQHEFTLQDQTVNTVDYFDVLRHLRENFQCRHSELYCKHDNLPARLKRTGKP